jgi:hypothetical protein
MHIRHASSKTYRLGNLPLAVVSQEKVLGTILNSDLCPSANTTALAKKANGRVAVLSRLLGRFPAAQFARIFSTLIRPLLEVNIQACAPYLKRDITTLESVQRRATKRVVGLSQYAYEDRLKILNLFPLAYRRLRGDLILTYKILTSRDHPNKDLLKLAGTYNLRGHVFKRGITRSHLLCRKHSFAIRVCPVWNALPPMVVESPTIDIFEIRLDNWLLPRWPL